LVRAVRGAITVDKNDAGEIIEATKLLLNEIMSQNNLTEEELISMIFTVTPDLDQAFPAVAARECGYTQTPLMCSVEIPVPGSLPRCIRVMIHCHTDLAKAEIRHIYLREAVRLRPDLVKGGE
jgi:chorismate mutase